MGSAQVKSILALAEFVRSGARSAPIGPRHLQFSTTLQCAPSRLLLRNIQDSQYGSAHFSGRALIDREPVQADLTARIEQRNGIGPLQGFFKLTWDGHHSVSARFLGHTQPNSDGSTSITGALAVIGGQGSYANSSGEGTVVGYHSGSIGQPITFDVRLHIAGAASLPE
jgi:hypothetical protein